DSEPPPLVLEPVEHAIDPGAADEVGVQRFVVRAVDVHQLLHAVGCKGVHLCLETGSADGGHQELVRRLRAEDFLRGVPHGDEEVLSQDLGFLRTRGTRRESCNPTAGVRPLRGHQYSTRSRYKPHGGAVEPASLRERPSKSAAMRSGGSSTIVPTSVLTMWRRKLSAVISNSSASPRRCHSAPRTLRLKISCWVSVGVNARKSCSPSRSCAACARRSSSTGRGYHHARVCSNGDGSRRRQMR